MSATNTSDAGRSERQEEVSTALLHPKEPPPTRRGRRTRAALVDAARYVFEQVGYLDARLSDITARAGCSTGTFYTYFRGKDEVMAAVLQQLEEDMLEASGHRTGWKRSLPGDLDPLEQPRLSRGVPEERDADAVPGAGRRDRS